MTLSGGEVQTLVTFLKVNWEGAMIRARPPSRLAKTQLRTITQYTEP
jgi:hypothetical protein